MGDFRKLKPLLAVGALLGIQGLSATSHAAFAQATCSQSWSLDVPTDIGSSEFDKNLATGTANYGLNESFSWPVFVSTNTGLMQPHLADFNTEQSYDYLQITWGTNGNTTSSFTGNLGTLWSGFSFIPNYDRFGLKWVSDYSITRPKGARIDLMKFQCLPAAQQTTSAPVRTIQANKRYDAVHFNDADIHYYMVEQQPNTALVLTLDVNAADAYSDFDLYASTSTTRPDDSDFTWRGFNGGGGTSSAGEVLVIPAFANIDNRPVYIGVRNYSGKGHYSIRANRVPGDRQLTICTQDMTPSQVMSHPNWPSAMETLQRTVARVFQATEGNLFKDNVRIKQESGPFRGAGQNYFCGNDSACDWCMTAYGVASQGIDGCGFQGSGDGRMRIPNIRCMGSEIDPYHVPNRNWGFPDAFSKILLHESGHALGRMITHQNVGTMLPDQYRNNGAQTAHSVMNGPDDYVDSGYRFSTTFNYCPVNDPQASPDCPPSSDWTRIQTSGNANNWIFPLSTQSSQPWLRFQQNVRVRPFITFTAI